MDVQVLRSRHIGPVSQQASCNNLYYFPNKAKEITEDMPSRHGAVSDKVLVAACYGQYRKVSNELHLPLTGRYS